MTITKRHYETIAKAINEAATNHVCSDDGWRGVRETAEKIADVLAQDNPRFNRSRFLDACGFAEQGETIQENPLTPAQVQAGWTLTRTTDGWWDAVLRPKGSDVALDANSFETQAEALAWVQSR